MAGVTELEVVKELFRREIDSYVNSLMNGERFSVSYKGVDYSLVIDGFDFRCQELDIEIDLPWLYEEID